MNTISCQIESVQGNFYTINTMLGRFQNVPSCIGSCLVGDTVTVSFLNPAEHRNPMIIYKADSNVQFDSNRSMKATALTGSGQWLYPEGTHWNSYGLTIPVKRLIMKTEGVNSGNTYTLRSGMNEYIVGVAWPGATDQDKENQRLKHEMLHVRQHGLLAYTKQQGDLSSVILVQYRTIWYSPPDIRGVQGEITEYVLQGSATPNSPWVFTFGTDAAPLTESQSSRSRSDNSSACDRRQGYFFIDTFDDTQPVYIVCVNTGIHSLRVKNFTKYFSKWRNNPLRPENAGNVTVYGKYVIECGYSGWDKSTDALNDFNYTIGLDDPATFKMKCQDGSFVQIPLPDNNTYRANITYYKRKPDFTYEEIVVSLRDILSAGRTLRKLKSCGIYTYYDTPIYNMANALSGILISTGAIWNLNSSRWPLWATKAGPLMYLWASSQADGPGPELPGACYFSILTLDLEKKALAVKNEQISLKSTFEPYPGWLSDKMTEESIMATDSRSTSVGFGSYTNYTVVTQDAGGNDIVVPNTVSQYLNGWVYDGIDPAYVANKYIESDQYLPHPWPTAGGPTFVQNLLNTQDTLMMSSLFCPSGCLDKDGNHYMIVSEPIHFYSGIGTGYVYDPPPNPPPPYFVPPQLKLTLSSQETESISWFYGLKNKQGWYVDYYQWYVTPHSVVRAYSRHDGIPYHYWLQDPVQWPLDAQPWTDEIDFYYYATSSLPKVLEFTCLSGYDRGDVEFLGSFELPFSGSIDPVKTQHWVNHKTSNPTIETRYLTNIIRTPSGGGAASTLEITQKFTWNNPATSFSQKKATAFPFALNCWQWAVTGKYLIVLRQMYQEDNGAIKSQDISNPTSDLQNEYPWIEIYNASSLAFVGRKPLWPSSVTPFKKLYWKNPPKFVCETDINDNTWIHVYSTWNSIDPNFVPDLTLNVDLRNEFLVTKGGVITQEAYDLGTTMFRPGQPSTTEASNLVINDGKMIWLDQEKNLLEYENKPLPI